MKKIILVIFTLFVFITGSYASEILVESQISNVDKLIREKGSKYGNKKVLVVFDLDNTLLTMSQGFGSNEWFDWQYGALKKCDIETKKECDSQTKKDKAFKNLDELLAYQTLLMTIIPMKTVESTIPDVVSALQKDGYPVIVETSRGPDMLSVTMRELRNNKLEFESSEIGEGFPESYIPVTEQNKYSLTDAEITAMKVLPARPSAYYEGVYFTAGQNKGAMLRALLSRLKLSYSAIVLVDDTRKHSEALQTAFKDSKVDLTTFEYTAKLNEVKAFEASNKKIEKKKFKRLSDAINYIKSN